MGEFPFFLMPAIDRTDRVSGGDTDRDEADAPL